MTIDRRAVLGGAALAALLAGAPRAQTSPAAAPPAPAQPTALDRLVAAMPAHRRALTMAGETVSGPGWDMILRESRAAQFTLLGEEHGVAEVPKLATALFRALRPAGYDRVALEISPPMADDLDAELRRGGLPRLTQVLAEPANWVAFYTLREEAAFLAAARASVPSGGPVLWGLDYEVGADRRLIAELRRRAPSVARPTLDALAAASTGGWSEYQSSRNFGKLFPFGGDPELVAAVRRAWPRPDARSALILNTLEETLRINAHNSAQEYHQSNQRRATLNRANFVRYWRAEKAAGRTPKVLFKFGAYHIARGRSAVNVHDVGNLAAEAAALEGKESFHLLLLPGLGSQHARFDPSTYAYGPQPAHSLRDLGIPQIGLPEGSGHSVIDLKALRPMTGRNVARAAPELAHAIHAYDAAVVFDRATASTPLA